MAGERGGQRAYARHRGVTHRAVQKALLDGRIQYDADGLIDFEKADASWASNTDPAKPRNSVSGNPKMRRGEGEAPAPGVGMKGARGQAPVGDGEGRGRDVLAYAIARAARESFEAKIKKLEYEKMAGKLIDAEEVRVAWFNTSRRARDLILAIPDRIAPVIAGTADSERISEVHSMLLSELRRVCEELSKEPAK